MVGAKPLSLEQPARQASKMHDRNIPYYLSDLSLSNDSQLSIGLLEKEKFIIR